MVRPKVLHVLTTTAGGLGQSVLSIIGSIDKDSFDVSAAFGPGYPLDSKFHDAGINVFTLRMGRGFSPKNLLAFFDIYSLLKRERFDIINVHGPVAGFLTRLAAPLAGAPSVIFTLHGYASLDEERSVLRPAFEAGESALDRLTDHYIAVSRHVKGVFLSKHNVPDEKVSVVCHGISQHAASADRGSLAGLVSLPGAVKSPVVGCVGLLERQKGTEYLIRAIPEVLKRIGDCSFLIIGDGALREGLESLSSRLGVSRSVRFLGWRDDAASLIGAMDVVALPSLRESFGMVLLEAMVRGVPVVASAVGGVPEVVVDGKTGILVPPADPAALSEALIRILSDRKTALEMGINGRARAVKEFSLSEVGRRYGEIYRMVLDRKRKGRSSPARRAEI